MMITRKICLKDSWNKKQRYILSGIVHNYVGTNGQVDIFYTRNGIRVTCNEEAFQKIVLECRDCELGFTIET